VLVLFYLWVVVVSPALLLRQRMPATWAPK
jgi:hypothetical protein